MSPPSAPKAEKSNESLPLGELMERTIVVEPIRDARTLGPTLRRTSFKGDGGEPNPQTYGNQREDGSE